MLNKKKYVNIAAHVRNSVRKYTEDKAEELQEPVLNIIHEKSDMKILK